MLKVILWAAALCFAGEFFVLWHFVGNPESVMITLISAGATFLLISFCTAAFAVYWGSLSPSKQAAILKRLKRPPTPHGNWFRKSLGVVAVILALSVGLPIALLIMGLAPSFFGKADTSQHYLPRKIAH